MVLAKYRDESEPLITKYARRYIRHEPNDLTTISVLFAVLAAVLFAMSGYYKGLLILGAACVALSGFFDLMDGQVARLTGKTSKSGDFLDHVGDRYSDMIIVFGFALSPYCRIEIALLAIIGILIASYMGTQAQAVGQGRLYSGLLGRAERMFILCLMPLGQYLLDFWLHRLGQGAPFTFDAIPFPLTLVELTMLFFAIAGQLTALDRARIIWNGLRSDEKDKKKD